jgi:hypothetical protein
VADESYRIVYQGPLVDTGSMDVEDLAPSLLGFGRALQAGVRALGDLETRVRVEVKADARPGSFDLGVVVFAMAGLGLWAKDARPSVEALFDRLFGPDWSVVKFFAWLRGRRPDRVESTESKTPGGAGDVSVTAENSTVVVARDVYLLASNEQVAKHLQRFTAPLVGEGIDGVEVKDPKKKRIVARVEKKEAREVQAAPRLPAPGTRLDDVSFTAWVVVAKAALESGLKWEVRLSEGDAMKSVVIEDQDFLDKLQRGDVKVSGGLVLRVQLRATQELGPDMKLRVGDYRIERVLEVGHRERERPLLPGAGEG